MIGVRVGITVLGSQIWDRVIASAPWAMVCQVVCQVGGVRWSVRWAVSGGLSGGRVVRWISLLFSRNWQLGVGSGSW